MLKNFRVLKLSNLKNSRALKLSKLAWNLYALGFKFEQVMAHLYVPFPDYEVGHSLTREYLDKGTQAMPLCAPATKNNIFIVVIE